VECKEALGKESARTKELDERRRKIFVGGLPKNLPDKELVNYFSQFGPIQKGYVVRDSITGNTRGFGFVIFEKEETMKIVQNITNHTIMGQNVQVKAANSKEQESQSNQQKSDGKGSQRKSQNNGDSSQYSSKKNINLPSANQDSDDLWHNSQNYNSDRYIGPHGNISQYELRGRNAFSTFKTPSPMNGMHSDVNIATYARGSPLVAGHIVSNQQYASDNLLRKPTVKNPGPARATPQAFYPSQSMKEIRRQIPSVKAIKVREVTSPLKDFSPNNSNVSSSRGVKSHSNFKSTFKEQSVMNQQMSLQAKRYISPAPVTSFQVRTYPGSQIIWGHTVEGNARINIPLFESKQSDLPRKQTIPEARPNMKPNTQWYPIEEENNEQSDLEKMSLDGRDIFG